MSGLINTSVQFFSIWWLSRSTSLLSLGGSFWASSKSQTKWFSYHQESNESSYWERQLERLKKISWNHFLWLHSEMKPGHSPSTSSATTLTHRVCKIRVHMPEGRHSWLQLGAWFWWVENQDFKDSCWMPGSIHPRLAEDQCSRTQNYSVFHSGLVHLQPGCQLQTWWDTNFYFNTFNF